MEFLITDGYLCLYLLFFSWKELLPNRDNLQLLVIFKVSQKNLKSGFNYIELLDTINIFKKD